LRLPFVSKTGQTKQQGKRKKKKKSTKRGKRQKRNKSKPDGPMETEIAKKTDTGKDKGANKHYSNFKDKWGKERRE